MIFGTVGTQLAFPRLVRAIEAVASRLGLEAVVQTMDPRFQSDVIKCQAFMTPEEFQDHVRAAHVIVSHAGIGTFVAAGQFAKPLIVMPRRAALGEHRNDHQMATVERFGTTPGIVVVETEEALEAALSRESLEPVAHAAGAERRSLIEAISKSLLFP